MINDDGSAMISDFGTSSIEAASFSGAAPTSASKGTCNYWAPELLGSEPREDRLSVHSSESDMWAFGMTIYVSRKRYTWNFLL